MSDSAPSPRKSPASATRTPSPNEDGAGELDLLNGTAWYSAWFYQRLQWPAQIERRRLGDLRPHLPDGAWEALLFAMRLHLERQMPLDARIPVQVDGRVEWWRVQGAVERNAFGKPAQLKGSMSDVSAEAALDPAHGAS